MFHTPPIKSSFTDESTSESYSDPLRSNHLTLQSRKESLGSIHIEDEELPQELPQQLDQQIENFLKDLKTPKYNKPLTPEQLSNNFQNFYTAFHRRTETFVKGSVFYKRRVSKIELLTSGEIEEQKIFEKKIDAKIRRYIEIAEEKICIELFDKLFNRFPKDVKTNDFIKRKLQIISKIKGIKFEKLLDIKDINLSNPLLEDLSRQFAEMNHYKTPCAKLKTLIRLHAAINQFLKNELSTEFVDGDYFLPLLIYLILINKNNADFYSNFIYIKRFRQDELLVEEPLYSLTNFEAAITFIQHLEFKDDKFNYEELTPEEVEFLATKHEIKDEFIDIVIPNDRHILSNSTDGIKLISSAIDSSFKSMFHRFGSASTQPSATPSSTTTTTTTGITPTTISQNATSTSLPDDASIGEGYNPLNKLVGAMRWRSGSAPQPPPQAVIDSVTQSQSSIPASNAATPITSNSTSIRSQPPVDISKFQNRTFQDLTVSELHELYNDYTTLTKWLSR